MEAMEAFFNVEFTAFVALSFILYSIRRATQIDKRYIPVIGILFGIAFAAFESQGFNFDIMMTGIKYALYAVGVVAGVKYTQMGLEKEKENGRGLLQPNILQNKQQGNMQEEQTTTTTTNNDLNNNVPNNEAENNVVSNNENNTPSNESTNTNNNSEEVDTSNDNSESKNQKSNNDNNEANARNTIQRLREENRRRRMQD
ncbi:hypothetical protein HNQ94_002870 [Salirhabdus euzebyi]|uniref:Holin n=1 Tax=Salirhabdus euzebyi TaxID=394506 RepID=A0A841Q7L7_9BACI|nr:hypothetical protein [Salirhabdus euzebyi]MBB6454388.1 hypothetical protein [Salirhabdus euzebyi]